MRRYCSDDRYNKQKRMELSPHTYAPTVPKTTGMSITGMVPNRVAFLKNIHLFIPKLVPFYYNVIIIIAYILYIKFRQLG